MPRRFKPLAGFANSPCIAIEIDDEGQSHEVFPDDTKPCGYVGAGRVWQPTWTLEELVNLVKGGKWEEIEQPKPKPAPKAPTVKQEPKPAPKAPVVPVIEAKSTETH